MFLVVGNEDRGCFVGAMGLGAKALITVEVVSGCAQAHSLIGPYRLYPFAREFWESRSVA